jgi:hypothetical protein
MPKRKAAKKRAVKKSKNRLFISFPLILFVLLCVGVYLVNVTFRAQAQDIKITAAIQGPPVTTPSTINSPADGTHFSAVPVDVTGDCSANTAYVEIFRNNFMSGSTICDGNNKFEIEIDLFKGRNDLTAHSFNVNDNEGPVSSVVTVYYDAPEPTPSQPATPESSDETNDQTPSNTTSQNQAEAPSPLLLKTAFVYKGYYVDQEIEWPLEISGGSKPYAFNIDWGDGSNTVISRKTEGPFNIKHKYKQPGGYKGSYKIKVQASDSNGAYAYLEFFVIVSDKNSDSFAGSIYHKTPPTLGNVRNWLWWAWPVYTTILFMALSYKLGEREEFKILKRRGLLRH